MKGTLPLITTVIDALNNDALLKGYMGGSVDAYAYEAPPNQAFPFITVEIVSSADWSAQDFDGDDIQFQVSAHFERGKAASSNGIDDVAKAMEQIREALSHRSGFDLEESPSEGASLSLDPLTGPVRVDTATDKRLVLCRYQSGQIIPGLIDSTATGQASRFQSISGVVTFRALISPSN